MKYVFSQECLLRFADGNLHFIGSPDDQRLAITKRVAEAVKAGQMPADDDIDALDGLPVIDAPADYLEAQQPKQEVTLI